MIGGFFTRKETESISRPDGKIYSCVACGLYKNCDSPRMKPYGNFKKKILIVGDSPNDIDDKKGKPWQGKVGKLLERTLKELGIDLFEDCLSTHAVFCSPIGGDGDSRAPSNFEVDCCRRSLLRSIKEYTPHVIIIFGNSGLYSLIGHRWKKDLGGITKWRGFTIPDQDYMAWVCPTFHPSYIERVSKPGITTVEEVIWKQDLKKAIEKVKQKVPVMVEPTIEYIDDLSVLDKVRKTTIAFDYETTGLKPHAPGHRIVCCAVATSPDHCYAFMMPKSKRARQPWVDLLARRSVRKMAHNMKYEETWSTVRLGQSVANWNWDSMIAAHVLDNRPGVTSLKFQAYVEFGIVDYASDISPYLSAVDNQNGNALNRIMDLLKIPGGKDQLLKYCALDSVYQYRLAEKQKNKRVPLLPRTNEAYQLLHKGILALARAEQQGIRVDVEYVERKKIQLTRKIEKLEAQFRATKFYRHWDHSVKGSPNIYSNAQLATYLYKVKKIKIEKETTSGQGATDDEALRQMNIPELQDLLQVRKLRKVRDTYLESFYREQVDGYIHTSFNLHLVQTFRSSSDRPNFQNIPKRDEESMQLCRKALFPRPGHQLLEVDYSGLEVRIAACYHKDPTMLKYIKDKTTDMHGDMAQQLFIIPEFDKDNHYHNTLRQAAKNGFVFPEFYGDYYGNCAENLACSWGKLPQGKWVSGQGISLNDGPFTLSDHLRSKGISSLSAFTEHVKKIEEDFWGNRFADYAAWKERWWKIYQKHGYISLLTGFTCSGVMGKNNAINYPVQGAAFHCLLWSFIRMDEIIREEGLQTRLIGQIHDSILLDVHPDELEYISEIIHRVTCFELPEAWKWINVPLDIDMELCPVDASWAEKAKYKFK